MDFFGAKPGIAVACAAAPSPTVAPAGSVAAPEEFVATVGSVAAVARAKRDVGEPGLPYNLARAAAFFRR